jgi:hypothetical protein
MHRSSPEQIENTRKAGARLYAEVLQRLALVTQEHAADCMGVHASTLSRAKEDVERTCHLMAALGFQLAPMDAVVTSYEELQSYKRLAFKYLQAELEHDRMTS